MKIQFLATNDSDDDSWLEVLEGSPGPSLRASSTFESINSDEHALFEHDMTDSTSESDKIQALEKTTDESDSESNSNPNGHSQRSLFRRSSTEQDTSYPIDIRLPEPNPFQSLLDKPLRLDRPEIGDIIRHFHDVYGICLTRPDESDYYQSWLCWMYRMAWNQIWDLVSRAPDCVVHAANYLFSLRNHPFWSGRKDCENEWHAMHAACCDVLTWWEENRLDGEPPRRHHAVNSKVSSGAVYSEEIEMYYAYEELRKGPDDYCNGSHETEDPFWNPRKSMQIAKSNEGKKSAVFSEQNGSPCAPPWPPQEVINFVTSKYHSLDKRSYEELNSYEISFETWVHWNEHECKNYI